MWIEATVCSLHACVSEVWGYLNVFWATSVDKEMLQYSLFCLFSTPLYILNCLNCESTSQQKIIQYLGNSFPLLTTCTVLGYLQHVGRGCRVGRSFCDGLHNYWKRPLTIPIYPTETCDSMQMKLISVTITLSGVTPWLIGKIIFCFLCYTWHI